MPPHVPASLRIAATATTLDPMPTMVKQEKQQPKDTTEEGDNGDATDEDIGEILASMSRADALRLLPTDMKDGKGSSTSILSAPSQSVFPVVDSKANQNIAAGVHANEASRCGVSSSTISFLIVSLVVLCIELAGRFVF